MKLLLIALLFLSGAFAADKPAATKPVDPATIKVDEVLCLKISLSKETLLHRQDQYKMLQQAMNDLQGSFDSESVVYQKLIDEVFTKNKVSKDDYQFDPKTRSFVKIDKPAPPPPAKPATPPAAK